MDGLTGIVPIVRAGAAILALSLPGFAILERLRFASELDGPFRVTIGVALGLSLHLILAMIGSALGLSLDILVWVAVALGIIGLMVTLPNRRAEGIMRSTGNWTGPFILGVALFAFGIASTRPMVAFSDAIDHVASVRAIDEQENLEPNDVFYADGDGVTPDARKGFYHTWLATVSRISGLDPRTVWYAFRPWGLLLGLWAFSGLARELLASRNRVLLALVLYPLVVHGNAAWFLDTFTYPHNFNWLLIWSALALFVADLDGPDRGRRAALVVMAAALAPLHVFAPVLFLSAALTIPAALAVFGFRSRALRAIRLWGVLVVAAGAPLWIRLASTYHPVNPIHIEASEVFYITRWLTLHTPGPMFAKFSIPSLLIVLISIPLLWRKGGHTWRRAALIGLAWCPLLISLNPVAGALLQPRVGYLFVRFLGIIPFAAVAAALIADGWRRRSLWGLSGWVTIAVVGGLCAMRAPAFWQLASFESHERDFAVSPERWRPGLDLLDASVAEGATVATDPMTGYCVPAYTSQRVIAVLDQHSSPSDSTLLSRIDDVARVLSPYRPLDEAVDILRRRGSRHVFLNFGYGRVVGSHFDVRLPDEEETVRARFEGPESPFRTIGRAGRCVLYELDDPSWRGGGPPPRYPTRLDPVAVDTTGARWLNPSFSLISVSVAPDTLAPGDTLTITCVLRKDGRDRDATPYRIVLQGQQVLGGRRAPFQAFDRLYSRLVRRSGRTRLDFSMVRRPLDGRYPPSIWDVGEIVADTFHLVVPPDLEPGHYRIGIAMPPQRLERNIALRDWLRPTGGIGMPVGEVVVLSGDR